MAWPLITVLHQSLTTKSLRSSLSSSVIASNDTASFARSSFSLNKVSATALKVRITLLFRLSILRFLSTLLFLSLLIFLTGAILVGGWLSTSWYLGFQTLWAPWAVRIRPMRKRMTFRVMTIGGPKTKRSRSNVWI